MTLELVLFIVVAAVAIFSAAFMLTSRNAVHSALFLVTNFACVAFFYLLLNAPFLAMIQITVYAGAIMVLFMFVIMLLGAEKLGTEPVRFRWLVPIASLLTAILLVLALFVVVQGNIGLFQPVPHEPEVRVVHALPGAPALDIYLNGSKALEPVDYRGATRFGEIAPGNYQMLAFPTCAVTDLTRCADPIASGARPVVSTTFKADNDTSITYVVSGTPSAPKVIAVPTDLSNLPDETSLRVIGVNALPGQTVKLVSLTSSVVTNNGDISQSVAANQITPDLPSGAASQSAVLTKGSYNLEWQSGGKAVNAVNNLVLQAKTSQILILVQESVPGGTTTQPALVLPPSVATEEAFGSPQQIGVTLLGPFLLPFELVSLLLLAAMVGAIILTREEVARRVRQRVVVSAAVRRINKATSAASPSVSSSVGGSAGSNVTSGGGSNAESSAD